MCRYLFLAERFDFFVVFSEFLAKCGNLLLEMVLGALAKVSKSTLVDIENFVKTVWPMKHGTVELYIVDWCTHKVKTHTLRQNKISRAVRAQVVEQLPLMSTFSSAWVSGVISCAYRVKGVKDSR